MGVIFCIIACFYCLLQSCSINRDAHSIMHQLYAGQYTQMAVIYICCAFIILAIKSKLSKDIGNDKEINEKDYKKAIDTVMQYQKASTSFIQRKLRIGYNYAAAIVDRMEEEGIISKPNIAGKREILRK